MNPQRRLWTQVTGNLLEELIGVHQRAHSAFGRKLGRPCAFPLFQGRRRNQTLIYNAEYDPSGKLRRGVLFVAVGGFIEAACRFQWPIGSGWRQWSPSGKQLARLAGRVYDALGDEANVDLAPMKMPIKLADWVGDLACEFAQRSGLPPDHPQMTKCLRQIFIRGGHETLEEQQYELPHEGLGGQLVAYTLAACRYRVDQAWKRVAATPGSPVQQWPKAPQLWISLTPDARQGVSLGFPRPPLPSSDSPGGIQLGTYPRAGMTVETALNAVTRMPIASIHEVTASFPAPKLAGDLPSWIVSLYNISQSGEQGGKIWNLAQPGVLAAAREAIKAWDRAFAKWAQPILKSA